MKKYLISLDKDQHRRELFFKQADSEGFEIFSALNTLNTDFQDLNKKFNLDKFEKYYRRSATKGEIGCTLSHLGVYQKIKYHTEINLNDYVLICEDDALFCEHFQENLIKIIPSEAEKPDVILVGQSKIADFNDIELEITYPTTWRIFQKKQNPYRLVYPYKNYYAGTVAYLIKKKTACTILASLEKGDLPYWLADDFILFEQIFRLNIQYVRPLMVIENPTLISNLEGVRGSRPHHFLTKLVKYPLKKLLAIKRNLGNSECPR